MDSTEQPTRLREAEADREAAIERAGGIRVGRPDVDPALPSHVPGVRKGNAKGQYEKMRGHRPDGTSTAARSTGINASSRDPVSEDMPNLSPA